MSAWRGKLRSRDRTRRLRIVVRYLLLRGSLTWGDQAEIAGQFGVSRQRVNQIVVQERRRMTLFAGGSSDQVVAEGDY